MMKYNIITWVAALLLVELDDFVRTQTIFLPIMDPDGYMKSDSDSEALLGQFGFNTDSLYLLVITTRKSATGRWKRLLLYIYIVSPVREKIPSISHHISMQKVDPHIVEWNLKSSLEVVVCPGQCQCILMRLERHHSWYNGPG
jgi:hypothetical protein